MSMMGKGSNPLAEIFSQSKQSENSPPVEEEKEIISPSEDILL